MNALPARLDELATAIRGARLAAIIHVGELLAEAREIFRHDRDEGGFTGWVETHCDFSVTTAYQAINVFERLGSEEFSGLRKLSQDALFTLAAPSTPETVVEEVQERAAKGEAVTAAEVKRLKAEAKRLSDDNDVLRAARRDLSERVEDLSTELERASEPQTITMKPDLASLEAQYAAFTGHWRSLPMELRERFWGDFATPFSAPANRLTASGLSKIASSGPVASAGVPEEANPAAEPRGDKGSATLRANSNGGRNGAAPPEAQDMPDIPLHLIRDDGLRERERLRRESA